MISEVNGVKYRAFNLMIGFHVKHCCQPMVQEQKISTEQAHAFLAGVVDISQASRLQNKYILYSYKNEQISIIFSQEGELLYVTPDPDYLYFK
ncbi:DUF4947 domain-containing protein [Streptococcus sanguinis]|uniref:DUF4947 domain-containing protein n=2 Tax=Streptococcus sanguinis TaxID=1305 RepID=UPI000204E239|nr:DUF4947 domain-containing protein [Streptococcus sanguinis]EGF10111.1 hypothetical protein HMPREF9394_0101 [Streptococcus sanguinis SK1057]